MTCGRVGARFTFLWFALALVATQSFASDKIALLIGNNQYTEKSAQLSNAVNDASDLADALTRLGFKVILRKDATIDQTKEAVREFAGELDKARVALFFYAGHAMQFQGNNYLLPVNATLKSERDVLLDGFDVANVLYLMGAAKSKNFVILDACRDNPFKDKFRAAAGLAQMVAPSDTLIAYSTSPGSVAYDGNGRNSIYTKNLLSQIAVSGQDVLKLFSVVGEAVQRETVNQRPPQVPWLLSSLRGQFGFSSAPVVAQASTSFAPSADSQINAERVFWESLDKTNPSELALYLERFPRGLYADIAQIRINTAKAPTSPSQTPSNAQLAAKSDIAAVDRTQNAVPANSTPNQNVIAQESVAAKPVAVALSTTSSAEPVNTSRSVVAPKNNAPAAAAIPNQIKFDDGTIYYGQIVAGRQHGQGSYQNSTGVKYVGNFESGLRNGKGVLNLPNGDSYEGDFVKDTLQGRGAYRFSSGDSFTGDFRANKADGSGEWKFSSGLRYVGTVQAGVITGSGELFFLNGSQYIGPVIAGEPNGIGVLIFKNGDRYDGAFTGGVMEGKGKLKLGNGLEYDGIFAAGKVNGQGKLKFADGSSFEGVFVGGVDIAKGIYTSADGKKSDAEIVAGQIKRL